MEKKIYIVNLLDRRYGSIWDQFANQFDNLKTRLYGMFVEGFEDQWKNSSMKVTSCGKTEVINSKRLHIDEWTGNDNKIKDLELLNAVKGLLNQGMRILVSEDVDKVVISACLPYDE